MVSPAAACVTQAMQDRPPRQAASAAGGRRPRGAVQNHRPSQIYRLELVQGARIIAPRRNNSAHLHRPWRAILPPFGIKPRTSDAWRPGLAAAFAFGRISNS